MIMAFIDTTNQCYQLDISHGNVDVYKANAETKIVKLEAQVLLIIIICTSTGMINGDIVIIVVTDSRKKGSVLSLLEWSI